MTASAYARHRGRANQAALREAIEAIGPLLPLTAHAPNREAARSLVASALRYGKSAGIDWHEMREIFNEVAERSPADPKEAISQVERALRGEVFQ